MSNFITLSSAGLFHGVDALRFMADPTLPIRHSDTPREKWPQIGPWVEEPDFACFELDQPHPLVFGMANRVPRGHWCGYICLNDAHNPVWPDNEDLLGFTEEITYSNDSLNLELVWQVLRYFNKRPKRIYGFDKGHYGDYAPGDRGFTLAASEQYTTFEQAKRLVNNLGRICVGRLKEVSR